ncbi:Periplasmic serine endoprotease DegP precursor [Phocoenobacter uteri]|uniref:Periplasmic serine endoprotease DegP n=1 Tax=Phocoenobacter uteri TaxID=146806 RepID=A0A379CB06_9PAST|nr:DegQ family serine endoprotease [Phocoenobacter uteri]MDG6881432.1 serine peptidase [Phocoenobacter uteri]SUB59461.1 Periplasmic serine endoprotease DegP precursor [Phocoenobacter uteri]
MNKKIQKTLLASLVLGATTLTFSSPSYANSILDAITKSNDRQTVSLAPMLEKVKPAVVSIEVEGKTKEQPMQPNLPDEFRFFFGDDFFGNRGERSHKFRGLGSGAIINAEKGYILTNNHVIDKAEKITVLLEDGRKFKAKLVGADPMSDVALIQVENPKNLTEIKFADSDKIRVGDFTVAIGNPFGLGQTVTSGIVSALGRSMGDLDKSYENYIQTDAAVNQGNSGGPLINLQGELIGVNTAIISPSGGNAGIAFAIPSNMAHNLINQIVEFGQVKRGMLGIKGGELNADLAKEFGVDAQQGAFVSEVLPNSAAEKAGIKAGDVIVKMNGKKIANFNEMRAKIATSGAGKEIELTYLRNNESKTVKVKLQSSDENAQIGSQDLLPELKGAKLSNHSEGSTKGVEVTEVAKGSMAELRGLEKGDIIIGVNRQAVKNVGELRKIIEKKPAVIALHILREDTNLFIIIQ